MKRQAKTQHLFYLYFLFLNKQKYMIYHTLTKNYAGCLKNSSLRLMCVVVILSFIELYMKPKKKKCIDTSN